MTPTFGDQLRTLRTSAGLSLADLSRIVRYSKAHLSRVENDLRPPTRTLARLCDSALGAEGRLIAWALPEDIDESDEDEPDVQSGGIAAPAEAARFQTMAVGSRASVATPVGRGRMSGKERRQQLLDVAKALFAEKGFDGTSVEEIAYRAGVSKPLVYEHFGGKEGLYAVVVDREMQALFTRITSALGDEAHPRLLLERATGALLDYVESSADGFRIMVRDSPVATSTGTFSSLLNDIAGQVEFILRKHGYDRELAALYSQALVGMAALTGQWWSEWRKPAKDLVAAHLVNLAWNGLAHLEDKPGNQARGRSEPC